jgi:hypothetical protein
VYRTMLNLTREENQVRSHVPLVKDTNEIVNLRKTDELLIETEDKVSYRVNLIAIIKFKI